MRLMRVKQGLLPIMAALLMQGPVRAQGAADAALLEMRDAFRRNATPTLTALLWRVQGHVLEPMAVYWEARARLESAPAADIRAAMDRMAGSYWEDRLRNDWLLQLGKQRDWATFEAELPRYRMNDDRQVQCYALMLDAAARRKPSDEAAQEVARLWHAQREADDACATAAKAFLDSGHLRAEAAWQRARLAMEAGRTAAAVQAVTLLNPDWVPMVHAIATDPARYLDEKFTAIRPRTKELVTLALIRLASQDVAAAAREMDHTRWKAQLTTEERSWVWGVIGKRMAQSLQGDALAAFANGNDRHMAPDHLAWKARAGLRAGTWGHVRDAIAAMDETQRQEPVWVYWRARAMQALREPDALTAHITASGLYRSIASHQGFYELLALEELGHSVTTPAPPAPLTPQEMAAVQTHPGLQRALAAMRLGLRSEGVREWNYTTNLHTRGGMGDRELLAAAALACQQEIWDRCINTSERTRAVQDQAQRFPMPFRAQVLRRTAEIGLDPAYVYGLIRQESRFVTDARSGVGASGLMQVMPATARWTARKIGLNDFQSHQITDRDTNILIGTAYLKLALDDLDGSMPLAAAAYNAGPARARAWRQGPVLAGEIWAENIPFEETRDYVKKVLANTTHYASLITGQPQSLRARLGVVGPPARQDSYNRELP
ncbi:lytic transglycosylase domain-containing protein [Hydrogenophaga flava]|uniref:lytic transglycosylase domain-containing protein n=1 Tax=Hydrogenophaga flava TaxID=65657 RepID=UPI0008265D13|nr:lytic transglycosylase domain-containing protein [Hydrogenophaga flava]